MAKGKNMLGKFRGKVGATVFRTEAGIGQIASEYNPNPKNPRTIAQTRQRTKMNLAGLISSLTPYAAIAGLNSNGRMARSEFVSHLLKVATVTGTGTSADPFKGVVPPEDIIFSKGTGVYVEAEQCAHDEASVRFGFVCPDATAILVIAILNKNGKAASMSVGSFNEKTGGTTFQGTLAVGTIGVNDNCSVYCVPILDVNGAASVITDVDVDWVNSEYSVSVARTLSTLGAYAKSYFMGITTEYV